MEKSTIKKVIECAAGTCASFATGVVLRKFMPEAGLAKKVIFSIGSALIGGVIGDMVSKSDAVKDVSNVVANVLGTSKNDISEEATDEVSQDTSELRNCFDDEVNEEKVTEKTTEEVTQPVAPSFVKAMENLYSGMEILLTILTSKRLIRLLKVKKPLSAMVTVLFAYVIVTWIMERTSIDVYYGNKEAVA